MKSTLKTLFLAGTGLLLSGCANTQNITLENGKKIAKPLIGSWSGSYQTPELRFSSRSWEIERKADGTYTSFTVLTVKGRAQKFRGKGTWWTDNQKYYQKLDSNDYPDVFEYTVIDGKQIKFKSANPDNENMEYIEQRKE